MWYVIILLVGICFALSVIMLIRNGKIFRYKMRLLEQAHRASIRDIDLNRKWEWRYDYLESVSCNDMMKKFWKPLDGFYKDKSFVEL